MRILSYTLKINQSYHIVLSVFTDSIFLNLYLRLNTFRQFRSYYSCEKNYILYFAIVNFIHDHNCYISQKLALRYSNNIYKLNIKCMKLIYLNGIVFLTPLAIFQNYLVQRSIINTALYLLQCLEITYG